MTRPLDRETRGAGGWSLAATVLALASCGGGDDRIAPDAATAPDAPAPALTVQVSFNGNDADDGINRPVETFKRAIAIATADPQVTHIVLASGHYTMRGGETFPYTVPPNVVGISGPEGGGAILEGTGAEPGLMMMGGGQLQDLELDNFTVAIDGAGALRFKNLRIAGSMIGVQAADASKLRIDNLDITGGAAGSGICATGLKLGTSVDLTVTNWTTHNLGTALDADSPDATFPGMIDIAKANIASNLGRTACQGNVIGLRNNAFTLKDSTIDGGDFGIDFIGGESLPAVVSNTTLRNLSVGLRSFGGTSRVAASSIMDNNVAILGDVGRWSLTNVTISRNSVGIFIATRGGDSNAQAALTMRDCTVTNSTMDGIELQGATDADLGTSADPGNNIIASNTPEGLNLGATTGQRHVDAVGNTWTPSVQGADDQGHYPTVETLTGPITSAVGDNFSIASGWTLQR